MNDRIAPRKEGAFFIMKKIKIIKDASPDVLEKNVNEAISSIESDDLDIKYMLEQNTIVIEYEEKVAKLMCVDCQFYDHTVGVAKAFGLCQCKGERVRFSTCACESFKDIRG